MQSRSNPRLPRLGGARGGAKKSRKTSSHSPLPPLYSFKGGDKRVVRKLKTPQQKYQESLGRALLSQGHDNRTDAEQLKERKQTWLMAVYTVRYAVPWIRTMVHVREEQATAANTIRHRWRVMNLRRYINIIAYVRIRSSIGWRMVLWMRITRKRLAARKLTDFIHAIRKVKYGASSVPVFRMIRWKLMKAQRLVRDYLVCKNARLLALSKKWERIEKEERAERSASTKADFREKIQGASKSLVGVGGALEGVSGLDKFLNIAGNKTQVFKSPEQEALFKKVTKRGRKIQNFGATEAKYEVIAWYLDYARATFQAESEDAVQDAVARKEKQRLERLIAKRNGQVTKGEIESMRSMVKMNELTDEAKIGEYMLDFKLGNKGQKPARNELPMFLMHKYLTRAHFSDMIKMANRRGRNDKTNDTYFRKASLEQLLKGTHPGTV